MNPGSGRPYDIKIGPGLLHELGRDARKCLGRSSGRVALISNARIYDLYGKAAAESLESQGFTVTWLLMGDGERFKSLRTLERLLLFLSQHRLERSDAIIALGGGVVGDLAGFAAAVYLRGINWIQVPTTLLAQIDASVGGKTGVNLAAGKNLVGAFHQPNSVLIDTQTLVSLPRRELTAGWCEAVKNGALSGRPLLELTARFLEKWGLDLMIAPSDRLEQVIAHQCAFKGSIVAGDPEESLAESGPRSRRILNFGHTIGHALEAVTGYRRFKHGEAVGHGMLVAGEISKNLGLLPASELESLREAIRLCGPLPRAGDLPEESIIRAVGHDKKSIGGVVQWVLLEQIGRPRIVAGDAVGGKVLRASLRSALRERH